ncbi:hypothetical protein HHL17_16335 [Chitinophaga sp. G-6-1-13]|uniref:Mannonate dehydratase n=1 Tax=Chitinophaga fulva TaxID=2728842 RepID=A0A848GLH2_9BACT|nr:hypothetical protein [Chitinophaga fulva]NML38777.1 hypothetical protein [Chitinophaga fulva]
MKRRNFVKAAGGYVLLFPLIKPFANISINEGDIDLIRILKIFKEKKFDGVFIPDHTPQMSCDAPWYAGMAYTLGYMKADLNLI